MGLNESFWPETLGTWIDQGYPVNEEGHPKPPNEVFGYDFSGFPLMIGWMPRHGFSEIVDESDDWVLTRTGTGAVLRTWKKKSGTPEHVEFEITTREAWDKAKAPLLELDLSRMGPIENLRDATENLAAEGKFSVMGQMFIYEYMRATLGDFTMLSSMLTEPEWIHDFCRVYTDFQIRHMRHAFEQGGKPDAIFVYDDLGYTNGLWASPDVMRDLVMPYHKELVDFAHGEGIQTLLHTCGDIREGMDMIVGCGWDCIQPMEAKAGNNVLEFSEKYEGKIAFMGNIDVMVLETGDNNAIRHEIESKLVPLRDRGVPYIFHSDHSIPPSISYDTYRFVLDVYHELAEY